MFHNPTKVATVSLRHTPMSTHLPARGQGPEKLCEQSTHPECDENFSFSDRHPHRLAILDSCKNKSSKGNIYLGTSHGVSCPKSIYKPLTSLPVPINEEQHNYPQYIQWVQLLKGSSTASDPQTRAPSIRLSKFPGHLLLPGPCSMSVSLEFSKGDSYHPNNNTNKCIITNRNVFVEARTKDI